MNNDLEMEVSTERIVQGWYCGIKVSGIMLADLDSELIVRIKESNEVELIGTNVFINKKDLI